MNSAHHDRDLLGGAGDRGGAGEPCGYEGSGAGGGQGEEVKADGAQHGEEDGKGFRLTRYWNLLEKYLKVSPIECRVLRPMLLTLAKQGGHSGCAAITFPFRYRRGCLRAGAPGTRKGLP